MKSWIWIQDTYCYGIYFKTQKETNPSKEDLKRECEIFLYQPISKDLRLIDTSGANTAKQIWLFVAFLPILSQL